MSKSNKPLVWGPFAAGGTITAFITPVLVILTFAVAVGLTPDIFQYEQMHAFAANWLGKLVLFGVITFSLWHAAHRARIAVHDFGLRADTQAAMGFYAIAGVANICTLIWLLQI